MKKYNYNLKMCKAIFDSDLNFDSVKNYNFLFNITVYIKRDMFTDLKHVVLLLHKKILWCF